jgi:alpha-amylase
LCSLVRDAADRQSAKATAIENLVFGSTMLREMTPTRSLVQSGLIAIVAACGGAAAPLAPLAPTAPPPAPRPSFADDPIVYFVMTDRFENGDPSNDHSYGRAREATPADDVGTFHGGDLRGLTRKVEAGYFDALGVNALWITAPYEQIHGWVVGGDKAFKHYAYHGYYALDYTLLDANMGTPDDLRALVGAAHKRGIRVLFDVVMNHPGYLDLVTARELGVKVLWPDADKATLRDYHQYIDYNNFAFGDWWGRAWVRAGLPGYLEGGADEQTKQLAYLPDFRTESKEAVKLPVFLQHKAGTRAVDLPNTTVRGYLIAWLTDWVRTYGIDGFRCDTVKHVEPEAWAELKRAAIAALAAWKAAHPADKIDDAPFWMVGEYWGHGPARGPLHDAGFDAMLNFELQDKLVPGDAAALDALFTDYAALQAGQPAHMLSYLSSHDTRLYDRAKLIDAGTALLLAPGGVQIYYGDETARPPGPEPAGDRQQATRSDMNWGSIDQAVLTHWRALGSFRARHVALARGAAASRVDAARGDRVVVALDVPAGGAVPVAPVFADGAKLRDAYAGQAYTAAAGKVVIARGGKVVLLEAAP